MSSKLRHIMEEMVTTEREYVRSLRYIIIHYFPEMERYDLPQDLRGKRSVIFGNLEKLLDFHSQFFLRELESCWKHPFRVSHCFLRHVGGCWCSYRWLVLYQWFMDSFLICVCLSFTAGAVCSLRPLQ